MTTAAREPGDKDILEQKPRSVVTGRTMDEIAKGAPKKTLNRKSAKKMSANASAGRCHAPILRRTKKS